MENQNQPQETTEERKTPEPAFFDPVPGGRKKGLGRLRELLGKNKWIFAVFILIVLAVVFSFAGSFLKKKNPEKETKLLGEENREIVTTALLDRRIEASKKEETQTERRGGGEIREIRKRNYKTDIAVYLEKEIAPFSRESFIQRHDEKKDEVPRLPSGTKIQALLEDKVFSFNVATPVAAVVPKDVMWKERIAIPKNSRFLGEASVLKSLDRINASFHLLIFPDGRQLRVRAMALSGDGSGGVKGRVETHKDMKVLKAIGESIVGGASLFLGGVRRDPYSLEDQMRLNLAQNLTDEARQDLRSVRTEKSITVEAYTPIQVLLLESI